MSRWILVCLLMPAIAVAEQPANKKKPAQQTAGPLEEVIVTGSRIRRHGYNVPGPVARLDRNALYASAQPTLEEALNRMPQVMPEYGRTSNNPGSGLSLIDLRGLGSNRTLVLLNGRRLAPAEMDNRVNVNTLPQALIKRVEIITGGATTVYGSDAVSGVVNFITRDDFEGLELQAGYYVTEHGDSDTYDYNLAWGHPFNNGRGHITLFGGYLERTATFAGDRKISAVPLIDTLEGEIVPTGSPVTPAGHIVYPSADLGHGPVTITFTPDGRPREFVDPGDLYNYAPANYLQLPLERYHVGLFLNYEATSRSEAYLEVLMSRNSIRRSLAATPAQGLFEINLDNPILSPEARQVFSENFIPTGPENVAFFLLKRPLGLGPRIFDNHNDYARFVTGIRGKLGDQWHFDAWMTYTRSSVDDLLRNDASRSRFQQGLLVDPATGKCFDPSNGCVPVNPFGAGAMSSEAIDFIRSGPFKNKSSRRQLLASAYIRGRPVRTWAGPVELALGFEWRSDSGHLTADEALFTGDTLGFGGDSDVDGSERVSEVFAEAMVPIATDAPLAKHLTLELGGRTSKYRHAGTAESYKLGGEWEPVTGLHFRSMYQRSIRAPDLVEAFQQVIRTTNDLGDNFDDPCSASRDPAGHGIADRFIAQGIPADQIGVFEAAEYYPTEFIRGGNPGVKPEEGKTWTAGVAFVGFEHWQVSLDYFDLRIEDAIGSADAAMVCFDPVNTSRVLCDRIRRDPVTFNAAEIDERTSNLGRLRTQGYDFQLAYSAQPPVFLSDDSGPADLTFELTWTHIHSLSRQQNPVVEPVECAGFFGFECPTTPKNRILSQAHYAKGRFDLLLAWRWIEGTVSTAERLARDYGYTNPIILIPRVSAKNYLDLMAGYRITDWLRMRLNIANLFGTHPPLMANAVFSNNTDTQFYDVFGRSYEFMLILRR